MHTNQITAVAALLLTFGFALPSATSQSCYTLTYVQACDRTTGPLICLECPQGSCCGNRSVVPNDPPTPLMVTMALSAGCNQGGKTQFTTATDPTGCRYYSPDFVTGCIPQGTGNCPPLCCPSDLTTIIAVPCLVDSLAGSNCTGGC
jgi:hypothetical protein